MALTKLSIQCPYSPNKRCQFIKYMVRLQKKCAYRYTHKKVYLKHCFQNEYGVHFVSSIFYTVVVLGGIFPLSVHVVNEVYYHIVFHRRLDGMFAFVPGLSAWKREFNFLRKFPNREGIIQYNIHAVSVLLLSGGQGCRLHFKWKPW